MMATLPVFLRLIMDSEGKININSASMVPPTTSPPAGSLGKVTLQFDLEIEEGIFNEIIHTGAKVIVKRPPLDVRDVVSGIQRLEIEAKAL